MENKKWKGVFARVWVGQAFSLFGSSLVDFALIWWLTEQTGSEAILALSTLITLVPRMLLGPFAGSLIDRMKRKVVMICADGLIALVTLGLLILFKYSEVGTVTIMIVLFLRSMGAMFHQPAAMSMTALLVPEDQLSRIGGLDRVLSGMMSIVAPIAGAFLIDLFTIEAVLYIDIVTATLAVVTLATARICEPVTVHENTSVLYETKIGLKYVLDSKSVFFVVMTCTLANIFCGPAISMKSLLVTKVFNGGVMELSCVTAASGIGIVIGGIIMGLWGGFSRKLITSALGWMGVGITSIITGIIPGSAFNVMVASMFFCSVGIAIGSASLEAFYQSSIPVAFQGRVFSVLNTLDNLSVPFGLLIAVILGDNISIQFWYIMMGVSHLLLGILWLASKNLKEAECNSDIIVDKA